MAKNLVIVESPAKAKTIEKILGKDFLVKSSFGHIADLAKKDFGIDIENGFKPTYEISADKKKVVADLKKEAKIAETVWLAADEDREGEAIAWHLFNQLGLKKEKTKRIVFHEITKTAILKAIENPREIDINLVNAQQARRVLDRLVGFEVSPVLWRKVKPSLSAGRVQSVAVRLIVDKEDEVKNFVITSSYRLTAKFYSTDTKKELLEAELPKRFATKDDATSFLSDCLNSSFAVKDIVKKPGKRTPAAPFTTSTLQQEASRKMGYSVSKTMVVAQQLYESGKITYMRTDSVNLSGQAIGQAKAMISNTFGEEYSKIRKYKTKSKSAQEAHEAIRPTDLTRNKISGDSAQQRLYDLIWKRTIASQMADAIIEKTNIEIEISGNKEILSAKGEVIIFDGFLKVYMESADDENGNSEETKGMLPVVNKGQKLTLFEMTATERFTQPPARYTEASLVKNLEELGIGRPSTFAPTISTIQKRQYIEKGEDEGHTRKYQLVCLKEGKLKERIDKEKTGSNKGKLIPTDIGVLVNKFLVNNFVNIIDFQFTAKAEIEFDAIAAGKKEWNEMIGTFYHPFKKRVVNAMENAEREKGERLVGKDPKSGKNLYVKIGRYGAMAQIGESEDEEKPRFASLKKGQSIEDISFEDAIRLFDFPRSVGIYEDLEMTVAIGRFGPYVKHNGLFVSLDKTDDPASIDEVRCVELIEAKRQKDRERFIKTFDEDTEIQLLNGRWGPYISYNKTNYKIPKTKEATELSYEEAVKLIKSQKGSGKKTTAKKAPAKKAVKKTAPKSAVKKKAVKRTAKKK
ncbi:MAG: type I DNA topoisomerase [Bacteroidales bacterium]|jgi:DNA topoisomerase-1|nr:type I DNA topoisomerase [Bacteroidales bacterium]